MLYERRRGVIRSSQRLKAVGVIEFNKPVIAPRKEDILFRGDLPDSWNNACLNVAWGSAEHGYTEGYRRGARLLVDHIVEQQRDQDYLVYPIIFLYRHHIELALKNIIRRTPYILDHPLTGAEQRHLDKHRIDLLWQDLKPLFAEVCKTAGWGRLPTEEEAAVDNYVRQLTEFDPDSYSCRYPRSKKGLPSLPADIRHINLRHFAEMVERLADYLDGLDTATSVLEENKLEMAAEWRSQMDY